MKLGLIIHRRRSRFIFEGVGAGAEAGAGAAENRAAPQLWKKVRQKERNNDYSAVKFIFTSEKLFTTYLP